MVRNFISMPLLLKVLTMATIALPIFCVQSLFPGHSINVFGQHVFVSDWWSSAAGMVTVVISGLMLTASLLMLKRSIYGRVVYILGFITMSLSIPLISYLLKIDSPNVLPSLISNLILSVVIGVYLYTNRDIQTYFKEKT